MPLSSALPLICEIVDGIKAKDTRSLAKAITLLESKNTHKKAMGEEILACLKDLRSPLSRKIAFTGPPGAGKSTLIEALSLSLLDQGLTLAILTIDPSSPLHGGSILADKTRMQRLSNCPGAFIRPSASGKGYLGGITATTFDVIDLVEAAGYDFILVETIGVGQNEVDIKDLVDQLILVLPPSAGDALQGIKKGIVEVVNLIVVNKYDGMLKQAAEATALHYQSAINAFSGTKVEVRLCSAIDNIGLKEICHFISNYPLNPQARHQNLASLFERIAQQELVQLFLMDPAIQQLIEQQKTSLSSGKTSLKQSITLLTTLLKSCLHEVNHKKE